VTRTLVLGMGNPYLRDDAVGIVLAACMRERFGDAPGVTWIEKCSAGGLNVLDLVAGHDRLVVLDSIKAGGAPGDWYRFDGRALRETLNLRNVHDTNLATALELGRRLGMRVPDDREVHVIAVEIADDLTFGERMTEALVARFCRCADDIAAEHAPLLAPRGAAAAPCGT
jgi:hydrogenase maturation protease